MRVRVPPRAPAEATSPRLKCCGFSPHFSGSRRVPDGNIGRRAPTEPPVNATEIAIYAVETKAIIHILWGLLLIASISLIGVSITYVLLRVKLRSAEKRERQLARHVATAATDVKRLQDKLSSLLDLEAQVASLKAQLHRAEAIRAKIEARVAEADADYRDVRQAA